MMAICLTPTGCVASVVGSVWDDLAGQIREAAGQMVTTLFGWWTTTPSFSVDTAVVSMAQRYVITWVALPIAVLALLAAVAWGVVGGGTSWIRDVARGLIVFGVVAAGSLPIVAALHAWCTELSKSLLSAVPTGAVGRRFIDLLTLPGSGTFTVIFWSLVVLVVSAVQYVLMLFRDGAVMVLAVTLPLAAAGQFTRGSILWLPRIFGWLLAFLLMKPAAALIYFLGLSMIGRGTGVHAVATAVCVLLTAIFALPALLRLVMFAAEAPSLRGAGMTLAATATGLAASGAQVAAARGIARSGPSGAAPAGGSGTPPPQPSAAGVSASLKSTGGATSSSPKGGQQ